MSIYKKLTNTNVANVPFNAHKLWTFNSASATTEPIGIVMETVKYTSASLHTYSSASTDLSSSIKYHQIDHLFYKDFQKNVNNRFGNTHYLTQQRELYDNVNVLSIPSGLYGIQIKPGTFSFSGSAGTTIVDDKKGNLIISGTDLTNHNTDVSTKLFHIGPTKGFKQYDIKSQFYRVKEDPNDITRYYSKDEITDDSYYLNTINYRNVTFSEKILSPELLISGNFNNGLHGWASSQTTIVSGSGSNAAMLGGTGAYPYLSLSNASLVVGKEYEVTVNVISASLEGNGSNAFIGINNDDSNGGFYNKTYIYGDDGLGKNLQISGNLGTYKKRFIPNKTSPHIYVSNYNHKVLIDSVSTKKVDAFPTINFENNITKGGELVLNGNFQEVGGEDFTHWTEQDTDNVATFSTIENGVRVDYTGIPTHPYLVRLRQTVGTRMTVGKTYKFEYETRSNVKEGLNARISNSNTFQIQTNQEDNFETTHAFRKNTQVFTLTKDLFNQGLDVNFPNNLQIQFYSKSGEIGTDQFFEVKNVSLKEVDTTAHSSIVSPHKDDYNFNPEDDFTLSMYVKPYHNAVLNNLYDRDNPKHQKSYLISKSTTKTIIPTPLNTRYGRMSLKTSGSSQPKEVPVDAQFPFEVYIEKINNSSQNVVFTKTDGDFKPSISAPIATGSFQHLICMTSASRMEIWLDGIRIASGSDTTVKRTQNKANLYFGSKGEQTSFFSGSMSNIMIFNEAKPSEQIHNLKNNFNNSPYVGNIFYSQGIATVTHPKYQYIAKPGPNSNNSGSFNSIKFNGSHTIYENEYQCTVEAHEYNYSNNVSTRKIQSDQHANLDNFATGSIWAPYVTTIGLYDDNHELLVVGKLGQPIKMSGETDTTLIIKWDT